MKMNIFRNMKLHHHVLQTLIKVWISLKFSYATAGDKFAISPRCIPMGTFKLDLTGTPFLVSETVQWTWKGKFPSSSAQNGTAFISNTCKYKYLHLQLFPPTCSLWQAMCIYHLIDTYCSIATSQYRSTWW
jgi:hypothetical protein